MLEQVAFAVAALLLLSSGLKVVTSKNLVHTVLWLGCMLAATAVLFVLLQAPFLAAIQLILYTGGLLTLMLFGVMLTQRDEGFVTIPNPSQRRVAGGVLAVVAFAVVANAVHNTPSLPNVRSAQLPTAQVGQLFFTQYALAFEVLAVLLLAATLGAIVLSRRADAGVASETPGADVPARRALPDPTAPTTERKEA